MELHELFMKKTFVTACGIINKVVLPRQVQKSKKGVLYVETYKRVARDRRTDFLA